MWVGRCPKPDYDIMHTRTIQYKNFLVRKYNLINLEKRFSYSLRKYKLKSVRVKAVIKFEEKYN